MPDKQHAEVCRLLEVHRDPELSEDLRMLAQLSVARLEHVLELMRIVLLNSSLAKVETGGKEFALRWDRQEGEVSTQSLRRGAIDGLTLAKP